VVTEEDVSEYGATKAGYCDVLRTQGSDRPMAVSILRFDTGEILSGELNNPERPLTVDVSISDQITDEAPAPGEEATFEYEKITDDTESVEVEVPANWTDRSGSSIDFLGFTLPAVSASTDLQEFFNTWSTPGISVIAAPELDSSNFESTLEFFAPEACDYLGRDVFEGHDLIGEFDVYVDCDGVDGMFYVVGAFYDVYYEAMVIVLAQVSDESELEVIDQALNTLYLP
jgi:serine protease Do